MHSRILGTDSVSAIGLGCMSMSMGYGPADDATSKVLLERAIDAGYRMLDTATMYGFGHNESLIGETLKSKRREFFLASKCGLHRDDDGQRRIDGRPDVLIDQCEASLKRLQTDVIDLYYLHRVDPNVPVEDSVGALAGLVEQGKIRGIGLSEVATDTLRRAHAVHPITAVQSEYSLWSRTPEFQMLEACEELGVSFVAFSPLARAFLTGKATDVSQLSSNDIRCTSARPRFEPENFEQNVKLLAPYLQIAEREGCTPAQLALAWLLARKDSKGRKTIIPIPGTKHIDYMEENAGAGDIELDDTVVSELDALINESTVVGRRYTDPLMDSTDSERDRT